MISTVQPEGGNPAGGLSVQHLTGANYQIALGWVPDGLAWGPYATKAQAETELANIRAGKVRNPAGVSTGNPAQAPGFGLQVSGLAPWFMRGLKIAFGGILIIIGVSKLTGAENAVTRAASKIKVIPL